MKLLPLILFPGTGYSIRTNSLIKSNDNLNVPNLHYVEQYMNDNLTTACMEAIYRGVASIGLSGLKPPLCLPTERALARGVG